jgi:hypothetical protein
MMVDPFHVDLVSSSSSVSGGRDMVNDFFWGRDCCVVDGYEWCQICQEVFALDAPFSQTMDAFVSFVDDVLVVVA